MGLKHVYIHDILNTTTVVVLQVIFCYRGLYVEMGSQRSESQVKEPQYRVVPPIFTQERVGA